MQVQDQKFNERKEYTLTGTPWYFGAYVNQARHNLSITLNDLSIKLGGKAIEDDSRLLDSRAIKILTDPNARPDDVQKAMDYYEKKLPFLFAMHYKYSEEEQNEKFGKKKNKPGVNITASPQGYVSILKRLIEELNNARNHYSHYNDKGALTASEDFFYLLNDAFDVNIRIVKSRFGLEEQEISHLRRFTHNNDKSFKNENGKTFKTVPNQAFKFHFNEKENKKAFTVIGLAFFICLFLDRGDVYLFLKKISGFKLDNTPSYKASLEVFCVNNLRLPIERLESDNSEQALFLDMCNELARAPRELFERLAPDQQKKFITKQNENEASMESEDDEAMELETKMVRKDSRFTFFAQRFLDITGAFRTLRFAVDLGNYHYSLYPKTIAGIDETRRLTKHLIGYGKLEDFEIDKRPDNYKRTYINTETYNETYLLTDKNSLHSLPPYILEIFPRYLVENNLIPLCHEDEPFWPSLETTPTNGAKSYPNKYIKPEIKKPLAYISTDELPALLFYELIQDKTSAQEIITNHIKKVRSFFEKIKAYEITPVSKDLMAKPTESEIIKRNNNEYNQRFESVIALLSKNNLKPQYIPEKLLNYLLGIKPKDASHNNEKAAQRLNLMIEEAERRIENMEMRESPQSKPGKKSFRKVKVGKLADILTEDIMLMQPPLKDDTGKNIPSSKANTTAFRVLQSHLAYFGGNKNKLPGIFEACKLSNSTNPHPFLDKISINDKLGIIEFYKSYFREKKKYLEHCRSMKKYEEYHFLKVKAPRQDMMLLIDEYLNNNPESGHSPFNLPRGLFHDTLMNYFKNNGSNKMKEYVNNNKIKSSLYLINRYFDLEHKDKAQDFYGWLRQYELFKNPFTLKGKNSYYSIEEMNQKANTLKSIVKEEGKKIDQLKSKKYGENQRKKEDERIINMRKRVKAYHLFIDNERYLRLAEAQDKLMFLCIKKMLANENNKLQLLNPNNNSIEDKNTFLLKNITAPNSPDIGKSILNCVPANGISLKFPFYKVNDNGSFNKINGSRQELGEADIIDKHLKIKNYGNFRKLMKDRRINNLCFYFQPDSKGKILLSRNILENELKAFEKKRPLVLEVIAKFEKTLYDKCKENGVKQFLDDKGIQKHTLYLGYYFNTYEANTDNNNFQITLNQIRNGFLHNQFPNVDEETMQNQQLKLDAKVWLAINDSFRPSATGSTKGYGIIDKISSLAKEQYKKMISIIKNNSSI